jgi:hypothetical protein
MQEEKIVLSEECLIGETAGGNMVILSDEVLKRYGIDWYTPSAAAFKFIVDDIDTHIVVVNRSFLARPDWFKDAVYAHEDGHIALGHVGQGEYSQPTEFTIQKEIEADRYAADLGYNMLGVLEWYVERHNWLYLSGRIEALQTTVNG